MSLFDSFLSTFKSTHRGAASALMSRQVRAAATLGALALAGTTGIAHAESDEPVEMTLACTYTCAANGFKVNVYQHNDLAQHVLQLLPAPVVYFSDFPNAVDGATYIGEQNVGGSSFSNLYCDQAGYYLNGSVYQNEVMSEWNSHTTPPLHVSDSPCGQTLNGASPLNFLLGQIQSYTTSPQWPVPEVCTDLGCASIPAALQHSPDYDNVDESDDGDDVGVVMEYCYDPVTEELYPCEHSGEADTGSGDGGPDSQPDAECFNAMTNSWGPCLHALGEGGDSDTAEDTFIDASDYNSASLEVTVLPPTNGTCTVQATMTVQASWGGNSEEANAIDLYSVDAAQPGELAALYADVSYVSVVGGLHIYDTTFEVPVADGLHSVVGAFPADTPSGFHTLSNHAIQCQCAPLVGDFDGNGSVGTSDLMQLLTALGSFNTTYDLDGDGVVATADLMVFLATYGQSSDC